MKKSITILALACLAVVTIRAQYYMRQVNSLADLVNINPSDLYKTYNVVNRTSENDGFGGMFYLTNNATGTNLGTKIALATNGWSAVRIYSSPVNVRWFGADNSGVNDCSLAFQDAINAASNTTKAVYVPRGVYKLTNSITIPGRLRIFGDNQLVSNIRFTPQADSTTAFNILASDNTYLEDFNLQKVGTFTNITGIAIASSGTTTELKIRRVTVDSFDKRGIDLTTSGFTAYNEIQSARIINSRRTDANTNNPPGVGIYSAASQIHATTIANCRFSANDHCIELRAKGDGLTIRDNQFESSGLNAGQTTEMIGTNLFDTILIDQAEGLVFQGNYVEKNIHGSGYGFLNLTNCNSPLILGGMFYNDTSGTAYTTNSVRLTGTTRNAKIMGAHFNTVAGSGSGHKFVNAATEGIGELDHCTFIGGAGALTTISTINPYITNVRVRLQGGVIGLAANDHTKPILTLDRGTRKHSFHQNNDVLTIRDETVGSNRLLLNTSGFLGITDGSMASGGASRLLHLQKDDTLTNSISYALRLEHTLAGGTNNYATNDHGIGIEFYGDREEGGTNSTTGIMGAIDAQWSDPKVGQEDSILRLRPVLNGTATDALFVTPNVIEQRNGTNAQALRVYNTYTDASNYERGVMEWSGNKYIIMTASGGTGSARRLALGTGGAADWEIDTTGNFIASNDNATDIGASGANRPRNIYLAQTIGGMSLVQLQGGGIIEFGVGTRSKISSPSDGLILLQNTASTDFTRLIFGSNDANGFSIKKSGTSALRIVNGNDTADTDIWARKFGATSSSARSIFNSSAGGGVSLSSSGQYQWTSTTTGDTTGDAGISRNAPGEVKITDGGSGFGSLLLSNATLHGRLILNPTALQTLAAGSPIVAVASKVRVAGSGGAVTLTATPTIADGTDGQLVYILGTDDTNTLTVQDQGTLASSNLELAAATRVLGKGDILVLMFDNTDSVWYEVSFSNN